MLPLKLPLILNALLRNLNLRFSLWSLFRYSYQNCKTQPHIIHWFTTRPIFRVKKGRITTGIWITPKSWLLNWVFWRLFFSWLCFVAWRKNYVRPYFSVATHFCKEPWMIWHHSHIWHCEIFYTFFMDYKVSTTALHLP